MWEEEKVIWSLGGFFSPFFLSSCIYGSRDLKKFSNSNYREVDLWKKNLPSLYFLCTSSFELAHEMREEREWGKSGLEEFFHVFLNRKAWKYPLLWNHQRYREQDVLEIITIFCAILSIRYRKMILRFLKIWKCWLHIHVMWCHHRSGAEIDLNFRGL